MQNFQKNTSKHTPTWPCATILLLVLFSCLAIGFGPSKKVANSNGNLASQQSGTTGHVHQPANAIDRSIDPTLIPDSKAYSLLFRFLSKPSDEREKLVVRSFIEDMGIATEDADGLIAASEEFNQLVGELDRQAIEIKQRDGQSLGPEAIQQLTSLELQKENIVSDIAASLPKRLRGESMQNLRRYINERFKRHMKIVPAKSN